MLWFPEDGTSFTYRLVVPDFWRSFCDWIDLDEASKPTVCSHYIHNSADDQAFFVSAGCSLILVAVATNYLSKSPGSFVIEARPATTAELREPHGRWERTAKVSFKFEPQWRKRPKFTGNLQHHACSEHMISAADGSRWLATTSHSWFAGRE